VIVMGANLPPAFIVQHLPELLEGAKNGLSGLAVMMLIIVYATSDASRRPA
jgi:hypothetical protein